MALNMGAPHYIQTRGAVVSAEQGRVFSVGISFIVIIAVAMAVRFYVRFGIIKSVGSDDVLMLLGTLATFGLSAASMVAAYHGVGLHKDQIAIDHMAHMLQAIYSTRLLYLAANMLVKSSLLMFYLRLDQRTLMRWTVYILMFVIIGYSIASFGLMTFSCYPPATFWDATGSTQGKCIEPNTQQTYYDVSGVLNVAIDLAIYIVPIPMLWKILIPTSQKIALTFIFGLGLAAVAASCVRLSYVRLLAHTDDMFFYLADSLNWCSIEIYLAIFCGSASAYKVLLCTYLPALLGYPREKNYYDANHHESRRNNRLDQVLGGVRSGKSTIVGAAGAMRNTADNDGGDLMVQNGTNNSILMKTEFRMEVLDSKNKSEDSGDGSPGVSGSGSHQHGMV
ncbi:hypothetical protein DL765_005398 [Monosporascus sp. GIB2]|nr:hypothetical protein DL765_005398 [Monosporascus sp. GIB2]